jgi:hypothetical protein
MRFCNPLLSFNAGSQEKSDFFFPSSHLWDRVLVCETEYFLQDATEKVGYARAFK